MMQRVIEWKGTVDRLSIGQAKILSITIVLVLLGYHAGVNFHLNVDRSESSCHGLQTDGRYRADDYKQWHPYGCMIHKYSRSQTEKCLPKGAVNGTEQYFAFIGDSRVRKLFQAFASHLESSTQKSESTPDENKRRLSGRFQQVKDCLVYTNDKLSLKLSYAPGSIENENVIAMLRETVSNDPVSLARIIVLNSGFSFSEGPMPSLNEYKSGLNNLIQIVKNSSYRNAGSLLLWMPLTLTELTEHELEKTGEMVDRYNQAAEEVLRLSPFRFWHSAGLVYNRLAGRSVSQTVPVQQTLQMLLNMHCNKYMVYDDGTCCRPRESVTIVQMISLTALLLCLKITVARLVYRWFRKLRSSPKANVEADVSMMAVERIEAATAKSKETTTTSQLNTCLTAIDSLGRLGLIMAYFFICDRMTIFTKENKYYTSASFWIPIILVFALGFSFKRQSRSSKVLHRDQTDEWKGWMQLVILIYHMTGASKIIPIYMHVRFLVSSYLFLTGYGHLFYFWNGGNPSFTRLCQVVFRMNLLTVALCLCMNRPYQSYYFVPLVTFWYLVVYALLALPPKANAQICETNPIGYLFIAAKFVALITCVTLLYFGQNIFEMIFQFPLWKALFVTKDGQIHEWWFRWSLDRYSISFGMIFGLLYLIAQKDGLIDDSSPTRNLLSSRVGTSATVLVATLGLGGYTAFTFNCEDKTKCNELHSYIVFIPIVSFIILRNMSGPIRSRYSSFFAWFGRISLELFIGQYHSWLAADSQGILILLPDFPILNGCITTFIFVCLAHEVNVITGQLVAIAVPADDWKKTLRNVVIFAVVLLIFAFIH